MAALEDFEKILKEVVNAKRLSASKMNALTEIAMKNMENDTQLVSILYRTHKSLPNVSKVSSLYIFDALSRAAKHHVVKHGISGGAYTQPGNTATFLLKIEGVLEGLFQDMVTSGSLESKEKTKKVLDIWVKGNTFPPAILSQLSNILKPTDKVPDPTPMPTVDPRMNTQPTSNPPATVVQSPLTPLLDPQAALLALLTQAAASSVDLSASQIITNMGAPSQLDAAQLAVLQQLAHTAASVPSVSQTLPPPEPVNVQIFPSSSGVSGSSHSPSLPSSHRDEPHNMGKKEQRYNRFRSPENEIGPDPHFDPDNKYKGGLRSRGRDNRKWDNRDRDSDRYRNSERDRSPRPPHVGRGGRSRSRSPPSRYGGGRNSRLHSPPRRSRFVSPSRRQESISKPENDLGKDEFGRDIRPQSPNSNPPPVTHDKSPPLPSPPTPITKPRVEPRSSLAVTTNLVPKSVSPLVTANTASNKPSAPLVSNTVPYSELGMDSFDLSTFDYTSPASWEGLGKMWQVTHGYLPSTEQLMQFVISCGIGQMSSLEPSDSNPQQSAGFTSQSWGQEQLSGGFPNGNGRNIHPGNNIAQATDSIVLGGGDTNSLENLSISGGQKPALQENQASSSSSGRMQRVGDKWVFVRGSTTDVS